MFVVVINMHIHPPYNVGLLTWLCSASASPSVGTALHGYGHGPRPCLVLVLIDLRYRHPTFLGDHSLLSTGFRMCRRHRLPHFSFLDLAWCRLFIRSLDLVKHFCSAVRPSAEFVRVGSLSL